MPHGVLLEVWTCQRVDESPKRAHVIYLRAACALVQELHGTELQDLVQEGRRLVDVYRHRLAAAGVSHGLVTVLQSGAVCTATLTFYSQPNLGAA